MSKKHKLRNEHEFDLSVRGYNERTEQLVLPMEIRHSYFNHQNVWKDIFEGGHKSVIDEAGKHSGPILVVGSGPGTDDFGPRLKEWKGAIITSISQASTCHYYGHAPEYIVGLDPRHKWKTLEEVDTWEGKDSTLILHPCMHPNLVSNWPLKKMYFRIVEAQTGFYFQVLPIAYNFIKTVLFIYGSTLPAQISFAHMLGYDPIILMGCEFGPSRYRRWWYDRDMKVTVKHGKVKKEYGWRQEKPHKRIERNKESLVVADNGVVTDKLSIYYKRGLFCVLRIDRPNLLNCSRKDESIIDEFPFMTIDEAIKRQETGYDDLYISDQEIKDRTEIYLAKANEYLLVIEEGGEENVRLYEDENALQSVPAFLAQFKEAGVEPNIEKNVERIKWLYEQIGRETPGHMEVPEKEAEVGLPGAKE